jgi:hypothetical protein
MIRLVNNKVISELDDDEYEDNSLLEPALNINDGHDDADDTFDMDVPPTTGNEYLRRVR